MKSYEVKLVKVVSQEAHATVSVTAATEAEAIEKAMNLHHARKVVFATAIQEPITDGPAKVVSVEEIVDLEQSLD